MTSQKIWNSKEHVKNENDVPISAIVSFQESVWRNNEKRKIDVFAGLPASGAFCNIGAEKKRCRWHQSELS